MSATATSRDRIHGVQVKPLRIMPDERGWLMEVLRRDDDGLFTQFGQVYVSATYPGVVKAWHFHRQQTDNFACVAGMIKLVLVDTREDSPTRDPGPLLGRHPCSCGARTLRIEWLAH